jgi:hypothetical protein
MEKRVTIEDFERERKHMGKRLFDSLEQELVNLLMCGTIRRSEGEEAMIDACQVILDDMKHLARYGTEPFINYYEYKNISVKTGNPLDPERDAFLKCLKRGELPERRSPAAPNAVENS